MKRNDHMPSRSAKSRTVVVLGASDKPDRYSNRAVRMLKAEGFRVLPVHPCLRQIEGLPVSRFLSEIHEPVDTLTLYLSTERSAAVLDSIVALRPGRVILNPGTEHKLLEDRLESAGIPFLKACTLVMLSTGQF